MERAISALHLSAAPTSCPCRDSEKKAIEDFLCSALSSRQGGSMYVCGSPGAGKTACTTEVVERVKTWAMEPVRTVLACWVPRCFACSLAVLDLTQLPFLLSSFVFFAPSSSTTSSVLQRSKGSGSEDVSHVFVNAMKLLDPNVLYSKIVEEATGQWLAGPAAKAALGN